ncbi:MAG: hypothetical protein HC836_48505 [Richelia sp. RM2_1_2]|nr:hypothetical protein [Richelia sp. RM1_1_1]NJO65648.1 hypothetical protein [Richelia sp. RM2_1_2]
MNDPNLDSSTYRIAEFLRDGLNYRLYKVHKNVVAVRHFVNYNSLPTDLSCFPLLKVYRVSEIFKDFHSETKATIGYCLSFPDEENIPGILRWAAVNINELLQEYAITHRGCSPEINLEKDMNAEYRVMSLKGEPLYSLLQFNFTFTEN